ncbi:MAG: hypothetical protein QOH44_155 [Actinomycetota bacterium]|nr:hypothetical protein [Actinomycetota bacterium]
MRKNLSMRRIGLGDVRDDGGAIENATHYGPVVRYANGSGTRPESEVF